MRKDSSERHRKLDRIFHNVPGRDEPDGIRAAAHPRGSQRYIVFELQMAARQFVLGDHMIIWTGWSNSIGACNLAFSTDSRLHIQITLGEAAMEIGRVSDCSERYRKDQGF
jgi:hypothetical protein